MSHPSRRHTTMTSGKAAEEQAPVVAQPAAMEYEQANVEAFEAASKHVSELLSKPENLESLDQIKLTISRKKATIESQLRNAVQTQLEGIEKGLQGLKISTDVVQDIKRGMSNVEEVYKQCEELSDIISPLKEVNRRYQQLKTTNTHINSIFGVPHIVENIHKMIEDGELLQAHQELAELEHTRDELLIQLHQGKDAFVDKNTSLHRYFEPLTALSAALGQQLWLVMRAVPENVVSSPATVVTALRIVQREEKADHYIDDNLRERGIPLSLIPERPKKWREKCVQIMESSINNKFIDIRPQSHSMEENKEWLDDLLTEVATVCYQDLKAMKENGVNCFPPDYDILEMYIKAYHTNLKEVVKELIDRELNARDIIKLMVWVGDVRQSFRDVLEIDLQQYGKLIDDKIEESLEKTCVEQVQWNVSELVKKMIHSEEEEWSATDPPESDNSGCFYTTVGILLYEMIDQNIGALSMLGGNTKELLLHECLKQVSVFQQKYKESVDSKFSSYLSSGRSDPPLYFEYMIAVANNCHSCIEFTERLKSTSEIDMGRLKSEIGKLFGDICEKYKSVSFHCCDILITIMFEDLSPVLDGLMTKEQWLNKPMDLVDKIEGTILDYNSDFERLKQNCRTYVIVQTQQRILRFYFESMMKKKIVLKKKENREKAASFIREESEKLGTLFMRLSHATTPKYTKILKQFAELISSNLDTVPFIIGGLSTNYPEVKFHHVVAVLAMRGDLNKTSVQKLMDRTPLTIESGDQDREMSPTRDSKSILSQISVHNPYALF